MLDQTHDVVADFYNDVSADVIHLVASLSFEQFKEQTEKLNDLATYSALTQRAERIGYRINKVVYRGYHANPKLQAMHDNAIEARTKLKLEAETETQAQELADLRLTREAERAAQKRAMEHEQIAHQNRVKAMAHDETMRQARVEHERAMEAKRAANELIVRHRQAMNREKTAFLETIHAMQVDVTRYLTARYQNADRLIRIEGNGSTRMHLHQEV